MKNSLTIVLLALLLLALLMANVLWGSEPLTMAELRQSFTEGLHDLGGIFCGHPLGEWNMVWESRIPQAFTALMCGAALSTSGLLLQTAFRNPLAGPSILGIDSGANLGVALVMLMLGGTATIGGLSLSGYLLIVMAAMLGSMLVMMLLILLSSMLRNGVMLLITGVIISYITGSLISLLNFSATEEGVHNFVIWGMGNFNGVSLDRLPLFCGLIAMGLTGALLLIKPLDALLLGDNYARNLGISIRHTRNGLLLVTGILTATTTAFCGPISFIGLAVPHIARMLTQRASHRLLLPITMMMGATLTLVCNLLSTTLPSSGTLIPINVITPLIGAPVILYVIFRRN